MTSNQQMRKTFILQSDQLGQKQRFGLFSQPISTAIGDNGPYQHQKHPRRQDHKPFTQPRNVVVSHPRNGQTESGYFGKLNPLLGTVKTDADSKIYPKDGKHPDYGKLHEKNFIPAPTNKLLGKGSYPYKEQNPPPLNPKRNRTSEGNVRTKSRNIVTNPTSNIEKDLFQHVEHMKDPFDNAKQIEKLRKNSVKKIDHEKPFRSTAYGPKELNTTKNVFGTEVKFPEKQRRPHSSNVSHTQHEEVFKYSNPTKWGIYGYFTPFYDHKPDPMKEKKRQPKVEGEEKKVFKAMSIAKTRPSSSITGNPTNMRRYISHSYNRRF